MQNNVAVQYSEEDTLNMAAVQSVKRETNQQCSWSFCGQYFGVST